LKVSQQISLLKAKKQRISAIILRSSQQNALFIENGKENAETTHSRIVHFHCDAIRVEKRKSS